MPSTVRVAERDPVLCRIRIRNPEDRKSHLFLYQERGGHRGGTDRNILSPDQSDCGRGRPYSSCVSIEEYNDNDNDNDIKITKKTYYTYYLSMKSCPISYKNLLYKNGQYFWDIR